MEKKAIKRGLTRKLLLSMLLIGLLPLVIGLAVAFYFGMREIQEVNGANFQALAIETARKVDLVLAEEHAKTERIARHPTIIQELERRRDELEGLDSSSVQVLLDQEQEAWATQDSEFSATITNNRASQILLQFFQGLDPAQGPRQSTVARHTTRALFITDVMGRLVGTIYSNGGISYLHSQETWWKKAFNRKIGKSHIGNLTHSKPLDSYTFSISIPIMDSIRYQAVGVLHRVYDAKEFFAPSVDLVQFGKTGHAMLIDSNGLVLSCPILPTGARISDPQLVSMVTPLEPGWALGPSDGHEGQHQSIIGFAPLPTISRITADSTGNVWHLFVWQSSEELFAPIYNLLSWIGLFGGIGCLLLLSLGFLVARLVVSPIIQLQQATKLVGTRELEEPIVIKTGDEIEELAEEFNRMNAQLQAAFSGLISEVNTKALEVEYLQESTTQILEGIPEPVMMVDEHERVQYMNDACSHALGLKNGNGKGENFFELLSSGSQGQKVLRKGMQTLLKSTSPGMEGGGLEEKESSPNPQDPLMQRDTDPSSHGDQIITISNRVYRYHWFPIRARPGENQRYGLVLRDATNEQQFQDELIGQEKFTSLGILCTGIGHELNNPLVGVIGLGEAIQEEQDASKMKEHAKAIVKHGQKMAKVIRDITGQVRDRSPIVVDLNEQLDQILKYMKIHEEFPQLVVQRECGDLPAFYGLPEDLRQVFYHVIKNAIQSMQGTGQVSIHIQKADNDDIEILIRDSGPGIPQNHLPKVFDPFFTTKKQGEGAGLGLTIVQRIVRKYGGRVQLSSQLGQGTLCKIILPLHKNPHLQEAAK